MINFLIFITNFFVCKSIYVKKHVLDLRLWFLLNAV